MIRITSKAKGYAAEEFLVEFLSPEGGETADNIRKVVSQTLKALGIKKKRVLAIVGDGASTNESASKKLSISRVVCAAHRTNSAVKRAIANCPLIRKLLDHCRSILEFFVRSIASKKRVQSLQAAYSSNPRKLLGYSETRWDSYYDALLRLVENSRALHDWYKEAKPTMHGLTKEELALLFDVIEILARCKWLTSSLTGNDEHSSPVAIWEVLPTLILAISSLLRAAKTHLQKWYCAYSEKHKPSIRFRRRIKFDGEVDELALNGQSAAFALSLAQSLAHYFINDIASKDYDTNETFSMELAASVFHPGWERSKDRILKSFAASASELTPDQNNFENWWRDNCLTILSLESSITDRQVPKRVREVLRDGFGNLKKLEMGELCQALALFGRNMLVTIQELDAQRIEHFRRAGKQFGLESEVRPLLKNHTPPLGYYSEDDEIEMPPPTRQRKKATRSRTFPKFHFDNHFHEIAAAASSRPVADWITCSEVSTLTSSLHLMAVCFHLVSPTSVQIERAFSSATLLDQPSRANLSDATFANETLIRVNYLKMKEDEFDRILQGPGPEQVASQISAQLPGSPTASNPRSPSFSRKSSITPSVSRKTSPVQSRRTSELSKIQLPSTPSTALLTSQPTTFNMSTSSSSTSISISAASSDTREGDITDSNSSISTSFDKTVKHIRDGKLSLLSAATAAAYYGEADDGFVSTTTTKSRSNETLPDHVKKLNLSEGRQEQYRRCDTKSMSYNELRQMLADGRCGWDANDVKNLPVIWGLSVRLDVEAQFWEQFRQLIIDKEAVYHTALRDSLIILQPLPENPPNYPDGLPRDLHIPLTDRWNEVTPVSRWQLVTPYLGDWPRNKRAIVELATTYGLQLVTVPGDGSCFFHSMVKVLLAEPGKIQNRKKKWTSRELRAAVVKYMLENWDTLGPKDVDNTDAGRAAWEVQMLKQKTWAEPSVVIATATFFDIGIVTWTLLGPPMTIWPSGADLGGKIPDKQTVILYNPRENHYEPIVPSEPNKPSSKKRKRS